VTSGDRVAVGKALWNPVELIVKFPLPVVLLAGVIVILSSVTINVGANVMAPARAFENLWREKSPSRSARDHGDTEPRDYAVVHAFDICNVHLHVARNVRRAAGPV